MHPAPRFGRHFGYPGSVLPDAHDRRDLSALRFEPVSIEIAVLARRAAWPRPDHHSGSHPRAIDVRPGRCNFEGILRFIIGVSGFDGSTFDAVSAGCDWGRDALLLDHMFAPMGAAATVTPGASKQFDLRGFNAVKPLDLPDLSPSRVLALGEDPAMIGLPATAQPLRARQPAQPAARASA